jgi:hypothetical protein
MKLGIRAIHNFIKGGFRRNILKGYQGHEIVTEGDLQAFTWVLIRNFLRKYDPTNERLRVLNKPYLRDLSAFPDLVIFKRGKPWIVIELKEQRQLTAATAEKERDKLVRARKVLQAKRGYLIYVAMKGERKAYTGPKGEGARFFYEVAIILEHGWDKEKVDSWREERRKWNKYVTGGEVS